MNEFERGLEQVPEQAAEAAAALASLRAPAEEAGRAISASFERAGASLARSLTRAAGDGKITLDELADAALRVIAALAKGGGPGSGGLSGAVAAALGSFAGARADGGPVLPGSSYLVGERGPEVFRPAAAGSVEPFSSPGAMMLNIQVERAAEGGLLRSEAQIAQALARAVLLGARRA